MAERRDWKQRHARDMTCGEGRAGQTYNSKFKGSRVESRSEKSRPVRRVLYESVRNSSTKIETAVKYCECGISQMHNTARRLTCRSIGCREFQYDLWYN